MVLAFAAVDELQSVTTKQKLRLSSTSSVALFNMLYQGGSRFCVCGRDFKCDDSNESY